MKARQCFSRSLALLFITLVIMSTLSCGEDINDGNGGQQGNGAAIYEKGIFGYIDRDGEVVIEPKFKAALDFIDGLAPVQTSDGWGFIDKKGDFAIEPQFLEADTFSEGLALVQSMESGLFGYIDKTGKYVIEPQYIQAYGFSEGLARVFDGNTAEAPNGFIDKTGVFVIAPNLAGIDNYGGRGDFHDGRALIIGVEAPAFSKYGYIDGAGNIAIEPRYDEAGRFSDGLAPVKIDDKWGYIDTSGNVVIPPQYDGAQSFSENVAGVVFFDDREDGYIEKDGSYIIRSQSGGPFREGLALIMIEGKYGYIDKSGSVVIKPQYQEAGNFSEGLAPVRY